MNNFYLEIQARTAMEMDSMEDVNISVGTIELGVPGTLRLDFNETSVEYSKRPDKKYDLTIYAKDFNEKLYDEDYAALGACPENLNYDFFKKLLPALTVNEIYTECYKAETPEIFYPLSLKRVRMVFGKDDNRKFLDITDKVTKKCRECFTCFIPTDIEDIVRKLSEFGDYECFCESFAEALFESIRTDDESPKKIGYHIFKAIKEKNFDDLFIAICGWPLESLMKKANIIPDTDSMFHDEIIEAELVGLWDDDVRETLSCKVNTKTREVFDIDTDFDGPKGKADFEDFKEFVSIDGIDYPLVPKDEFESGNKLMFWYGENE